MGWSFELNADNVERDQTLESPISANSPTCHKAESFLCVFQLPPLHPVGGELPALELCRGLNTWHQTLNLWARQQFINHLYSQPGVGGQHTWEQSEQAGAVVGRFPSNNTVGAPWFPQEGVISWSEWCRRLPGNCSCPSGMSKNCTWSVWYGGLFG